MLVPFSSCFSSPSSQSAFITSLSFKGGRRWRVTVKRSDMKRWRSVLRGKGGEKPLYRFTVFRRAKLQLNRSLRGRWLQPLILLLLFIPCVTKHMESTTMKQNSFTLQQWSQNPHLKQFMNIFLLTWGYDVKPKMVLVLLKSQENQPKSHNRKIKHKRNLTIGARFFRKKKIQPWL